MYDRAALVGTGDVCTQAVFAMQMNIYTVLVSASVREGRRTNSMIYRKVLGNRSQGRGRRTRVERQRKHSRWMEICGDETKERSGNRTRYLESV